MSIGVRNLTVLGEFKPFGLTVEDLDRKPSENDSEKFEYFLFDPTIPHVEGDDDPSSDCSDHELFIRGNRIIWSVGSLVHKRYTSGSTAIMVMAGSGQLQTLRLLRYLGGRSCAEGNINYGIQMAVSLAIGFLFLGGGTQTFSTGNSAIAALLITLYPRFPTGPNDNRCHLQAFRHLYVIAAESRRVQTVDVDTGLPVYAPIEMTIKETDHYSETSFCEVTPCILPERSVATYFEERGRLTIMKDLEEETIWTSDTLPLMVSYHKGRMQHSLWFVEITNCEAVDASSVSYAITSEVHKRRFSFRRIWQGKCSHFAASKVFLSVDNDGVPIICFLLQEQKVLLAVRLLLEDGNDDGLIDIRPHMSWSIPAIAAAPVVVTRPRVKVGLLSVTDIIVLGPENDLLLYSGKQCLCNYLLSISSCNGCTREVADTCYGLKITGVENAVGGRINVIANNGKVYRCALRRHPSSFLANDCIASMSEGLHSSFYDHFISLLWGDSESVYLSNTQSHVDSEWEAFRTAAMKICKRYSSCSDHSSTLPESAWNFLRNSKFHSNYSKHASFFGVSLSMGISCQAVDYNGSYLEDEQNREVSFYAQLLSETLESLHAVYENLKLNNLRKRDLEKLSVLLCNIAASLGEANYVDYYIRDFPCTQREVRSFHTAAAPRTPPCLFRWLERCLQLGYDSANINDIPALIRKNKCYVVSWARKIVSFYSILLGAAVIGKKLSSGVYCDIAKGSASTPEELVILAMVAEGFGRHQLDLVPVGVSLPLRHILVFHISDNLIGLACDHAEKALEKCRESPPTDWPASAYVLVGREDLAMACLGTLNTEHYSQNSVNLVSTSVPYMLHLQPVTIPSSLSDVTRLSSMKSEEEESSDDGMEHIFNSSTQLRYGCDNRLNEVRRLLCSVRPVAIQTSVSPSTSDQDLQQQQLWNLAQRTTALPFGRGAFTLSTTYTLLTEALVIPKLVLAGRLPAQQNAMVNLDPNVRSISELRSWPEFHNGVAAGLRLAPFQEKMPRTWIQHNKPLEPNFTHAGLLLALGLHEHLCVLAITDVYRYLSEVMAGSGQLQTLRLLRYLGGRSCAEGNINYGIQMAVSLAIGFLFLGGGTQTFSTGNSAIAALLITLYPRFPTGPNDNRCHLQAFRHLYVIAAESRRVQTVDVDTGLPVYAPIEMTIKETDHYSETSFCEVTPCILPERSVATYFEERGRLTIMKDLEEETIWTSDTLPLMVSYHKGRMQHSLWFVEITNCEAVDASSVSYAITSEVHKRRFSFRRIWQGKCSHFAASKVFLSVDNDGVPIICFLLQEQKVLLAVRLLLEDGNDDGLIDIRPHMSWSIPAIAAAPVVVTRPRVKVGLLSVTDIIVLGPENDLLLYSGKQCLCNYLLSISSCNGCTREVADTCYGLKITGVENAVGGRINVIANNGKVYRCALRRHPSSFLANDCIASMSEGLHSSFYDHFISLLWGDSESVYLSNTQSHVDSEWEAFRTAAMKICKRYSSCSDHSSTLPESAWNFLRNSKFHSNYSKHASFFGVSLSMGISCQAVDYNGSYLEDEQNREVSFYAQLLSETLESLHAVYENLKLNNLRKRDLEKLSVLLCNIAASLGEANYVDYYIRDFPCTQREVRSFHTAAAPRTPPCLFRWLERCLQLGYDSANINDIPALIRKNKCYVVSWARKIVSFYSILLGAVVIGKKLSSGVYCDIAKGSASTPEELVILAMVAEGFGRHQLDLVPVGVSLPLRHILVFHISDNLIGLACDHAEKALEKCRESPPTDWPASAYVLVGREDLAMACLGTLNTEHYSQNSVNLVSTSVPYMLHLQPVTIPSSLSDVTRLSSMKSEEEESSDDGMEHIFNSSTQLRYGCDNRLNEVRRLLCSVRPVAIQTSVSPSTSDQDLQQQQLWNLAQRTTALPFGRGAFTLSTTYTLLTEALVIPKLVLAGRLPAQQNAMVNLDPNVRSISELRSWPEFHNGVAAGLRLAPFQEKMPRTWIQYNKPLEPNFTHAGLLLALGLHEHLCVLAITDVYRYLSEEHDITTVGVLLGTAASYRGTMHPAISKMLYLHIPSRHPSSFPELELPTILQSAALMAIGLLYEGSAHPLTMKILLGEIGRRSSGDNVLEREGYAVAAGCALGLVALGRGKDAFGSVDSFVDRLFHYTGGKEVYNERSMAIGRTRDDHNRSTGQFMDGTQINVDVTSPGAIISLALIFLKTESEVIASRIYIPANHFDLQYVRPDFIMLRIIARNLITWNRVYPSRDWVESQIPDFVKVGVLKIGDAASDYDDFDSEALVQAYVNIVAGACISLGLKYAGTKNGDAQELLYNYAIYFLNEIKHVPAASKNDLPKGLSEFVDRGTLELCLHLIVLSLSVVMAGSGQLQTLRLLRYLGGRSCAEGNINYGIQMAVSLAIGFLFLGGGTQTFSTGNSAIAALLITLYPRFPTGPNDNRCHLQAFRHLYVIAAESRRVQTVDVDTGLPVYAPIEMTIKETDHYSETSFCEVTPCILPERSVLKSVRVCGPRYWPQVIHLVPEDKPWWRSGDKKDPFNGGLLYIKRKVGSCSYVDDPVGCQSLLSRAMHKIFDTSSSYNLGSFNVEQLVSAFSADPSLISFSQICWGSTLNSSFQDFCSQVLFECISKDRPALLQVYLSLYTIIGSMWEQVNNSRIVFYDSCFLYSLKLALAYNEAVMSGKLTRVKGGIIQSSYCCSITAPLITQHSHQSTYRD